MWRRFDGRYCGCGGYTLLELVLVLTLVGVLCAVALPPVARLRDRSSVSAAMVELSAAFSLARRAAVSRRELVSVVLDTAAGTVEVRAGSGDRLSRGTLGSRYGIVLGGNRDSAVYDPRGLGYGVSNLSVTVRRGRIVDTLTMSRLGRVRW